MILSYRVLRSESRDKFQDGLKPILAPETHFFANFLCLLDADFDIACSSYFDLDSTYLACPVTELTVGLPQACTVQFNGTTSSGKTAIETCSYAGTVLAPAMVLCNFSTLKSVKAVSLIPTETSTLSTTTVILLDNVVGNYYSSS